MSENLKKFLELVSKDEALKQKAMACNDMEKEDAIRVSIALAKEVGIELTEADFAKKEADGELSDDELDAVTGGVLACFCELAGGGGGTDANDHKKFGCACVIYGQGGDGRAEDSNCLCVTTGGGNDESQFFYWG